MAGGHLTQDLKCRFLQEFFNSQVESILDKVFQSFEKEFNIRAENFCFNIENVIPRRCSKIVF